MVTVYMWLLADGCVWKYVGVCGFVCMGVCGLTRWGGRMSRSLPSRAGRFENLNLVGSNSDPTCSTSGCVNPMTLKSIFVAS